MNPGAVVLLVTSPGVRFEAYEPLVLALRDEGASVVPVDFPCSGDAASLSASIVRAAAGRRVVVVAHGVGAALALSVHDQLAVERWVLVGPVLGVVPGRWVTRAAAATVDGTVELPALPRIEEVVGHDARSWTRCLSPALAVDLQGWATARHVPVDPSEVREPVWIEVGALDAVASVEATVPASRRFPDRRLVRPGIARLDPADYDHLGLVREPVPVRLAAHAAAQGW